MIVWEIDWRAPYAAFAPLAGEAHAHLLHGGDLSDAAAWSIIVAFPQEIVAAAGDDDPFPPLQRLVDRRAAPSSSARLPFASGLVGYAGYEAARFIEPSLDLPASTAGLPDLVFGYYEAAALFSRRARRAYVAGRDARACGRLRDALGEGEVRPPAAPAFGPLSSNFSPRQYAEAVRRVIDDILDGAYYQANISHRIGAVAEDGVCAFDLFRRIAARSDAAFGALLQYKDGAVLSNSPERFFRVSPEAGARRIVTEPIKGTRPRGDTAQDDARLAAELTGDPKDRAENVMIADLMRNDLSKICLDDSIREEAVCDLLTLANVHHLVSRISGVLRRDVSFTDILKALFPCGSVTGAPKIAAMTAIADVERVGRGPYCGAIGYIDDCGGADFAVAIRTMTMSQGGRALTAPVGGGVTLRSDPVKEYRETIHKAEGALASIKKSSEALL